MSEEIRQDQFEDKLIKANEILERLSDENISLEESVKLHKEGKKLLDEAAKILQNAKLVINEIEDEKDE
ncbi:exodeoxyribonuclease VII small subunit [Campylobacter sp. RM16187]|uniref:exodeoxyribonuclease VII small subunit n=1 Tax=Campylobacter sp. RM16187 TaxID=1660063 RepID=UPI0021B54615|nr:exodeoxyribonuclease VII small subunit [Campylobacter sp. RM16187]QKG28839.1 exodeoxyribonuclease VII, small subunit [Campylobacter sp. RM16187]